MLHGVGVSDQLADFKLGTVEPTILCYPAIRELAEVRQ